MLCFKVRNDVLEIQSLFCAFCVEDATDIQNKLFLCFLDKKIIMIS